MQVRQLEIENFVTGDESNIDNIHCQRANIINVTQKTFLPIVLLEKETNQL